MTSVGHVQLEGHCESRFEPLRRLAEHNLSVGTEIGLSLYIDIGGEPVVDLWGGWRDRDRRTPWTGDTIVNVWSTSKAVTSMAALMLVDRGQLDPDAPVARYWPEFAANGKEDIKVRNILGHTSGVSGWDLPFAPEEMYDLTASTAKLAAQRPWWEPGTQAGYHANNFGHLIGELVRRVTGKTLGQFVADDLASPLDADFHIGLADEHLGRVATIYGPRQTTLPSPPGDSGFSQWPIQKRTLAGCFVIPDRGNDADFRRAEIGATNGHGNARSIAKVMSAISLGGMSGGVRLLSPPTIDRIFEVQSDGTDLVLALPIRWGMGLALESAGVPFVRGAKTCFWGGWGGSMIVMDTERQVTFSYVMNQMQPGTIGSAVAAQYCEAVADVLAGI